MSFPNLPYSSFNEPLPPVPETDAGGVCVEFDEKWRPYIVTVLTALMSLSAWESDAERSAGEATLLMEIFKTAAPCP